MYVHVWEHKLWMCERYLYLVASFHFVVEIDAIHMSTIKKMPVVAIKNQKMLNLPRYLLHFIYSLSSKHTCDQYPFTIRV